jgi:hypothetical protein
MHREMIDARWSALIFQLVGGRVSWRNEEWICAIYGFVRGGRFVLGVVESEARHLVAPGLRLLSQGEQLESIGKL